MKIKPVIVATSGPELTDAERDLFKKFHPLGVVLFRRNIASEIIKDSEGKIIKIIQNKEKLINFINEIKAELGENCIIAIDQEGGKVKRLISPTFYDAPPAKKFGDVAEEQGIEFAAEECKTHYKKIAAELKTLGINVNFAPVADLRHEGAHDVIGDRSFGSNKNTIVRLCLAALEGMEEKGIIGCIKHIPGHGRSTKDSHKELPTINASLEELWQTDFYIFKKLSALTKCPLAMTAHIVYEALDLENPATLSKKVINYIKKDTGINFQGFVISDAIDMQALSGAYSAAEITKKAFAAGIDIVLECSGQIENMTEILGNAPDVSIDEFSELFG